MLATLINNILPLFSLDRLINLAKAYDYQGPMEKYPITYIFQTLTILNADVEKYLFLGEKIVNEKILDTGEIKVQVNDLGGIYLYQPVDEINYPSAESIIKMWRNRDKRLLDIEVKKILQAFYLNNVNDFNQTSNTFALLKKMFSPEKFFFINPSPRRCDRQEDYYGEDFKMTIAYGNLETLNVIHLTN